MFTLNLLDSLNKLTSRPSKLFWLGLCIVILTGFLLRSGGLVRDFPCSFHCDVRKQLTVIRQQVEYGDFTNFNAGYPIGHQQFTYAALAAAKHTREWLGISGKISDEAYYLTSRLFALGLSLAGLLALMLTAKRLMGRWAALATGLLFALDQFHIVHTHYAMGDVPQSGMALLALWACVCIAQENRLRDSLLAGLFIGMAVGIKYYGGFMGLIFILAHLLAPKKNWGGLFLGILAGAAGFVILTPPILVDPMNWLEMFLHQFRDQSSKSLLASPNGLGRIVSGWRLSWQQWRESSLVLPYLIFPALILMALKRERKDWLIFLATFLPLLIINGFRVVHLKDSDQVIQVGFMCLAVVRGVDIARQKLSFTPRLALITGFVLLLGLQAWHSAELTYTLRLPDTRFLARDWLDRRMPVASENNAVGLDHWQTMARMHGTTSAFYTQGKGYTQVIFPSRKPAEALAMLKSEEGKKLALIVLHSFKGDKLMLRLDKKSPPLKEFKLLWRSWHNPDIQVRDPNRISLDIPFRPLNLTPLGWNQVDFASTPYSMREVRQALLEAGDHQFTLFSPRPLKRFAFIVKGDGRIDIEHGGEKRHLLANPRGYQILDFEAKSGFPYFAHSYKIKVKARGRVALRMAISLAERAKLYQLAGQEDQAIIRWQKAIKAGHKLLPQDRLQLAMLLKRAKQPEQARDVLASLEKEHPGFARAMEQAAAARPQDAAGIMAMALGIPKHTIGWESYAQSLGSSGSSPGATVLDSTLHRKVLEVPVGKPSCSKFFARPLISQDWLWARFWIKAEPGLEEELGKVDIFAHVNHRPHSDAGAAPIITSGGDDYFPVDLRIKAPNLPLEPEFRVWSNGKRKLWLDRVELRSDLGAWAADMLKQAE
jgi:hypothetical protein